MDSAGHDHAQASPTGRAPHEQPAHVHGGGDCVRTTRRAPWAPTCRATLRGVSRARDILSSGHAALCDRSDSLTVARPGGRRVGRPAARAQLYGWRRNQHRRAPRCALCPGPREGVQHVRTGALSDPCPLSPRLSRAWQGRPACSRARSLRAAAGAVGHFRTVPILTETQSAVTGSDDLWRRAQLYACGREQLNFVFFSLGLWSTGSALHF